MKNTNFMKKTVATLIMLSFLVTVHTYAAVSGDATALDGASGPSSDNTDLSTTPSAPSGDNTDLSTTPSTPTGDNTDLSEPATPVVTTPVFVGNGAGVSGPSFGGSTGGSAITSGTPISAVATSTATSTVTTFDTTGINLMCANLFTNYMGYGKKNVSADVKRLQSFLNSELSLNLKVDGKFGPATHAAVKAFQTKYATSTLLPWDQAGLSKNLVKRPTGYVYKTTLRQINLLLCPSVNIPMPTLK